MCEYLSYALLTMLVASVAVLLRAWFVMNATPPECYGSNPTHIDQAYRDCADCPYRDDCFSE